MHYYVASNPELGVPLPGEKLVFRPRRPGNSLEFKQSLEEIFPSRAMALHILPRHDRQEQAIPSSFTFVVNDLAYNRSILSGTSLAC